MTIQRTVAVSIVFQPVSLVDLRNFLPVFIQLLLRDANRRAEFGGELAGRGIPQASNGSVPALDCHPFAVPVVSRRR